MWLPEGHFAHHVSDLGLGLDGVLRAKGTVGATRRMRGQGAVVRVRNGGVFVAKEEVGGGRGVSGAGGGKLSEPPHVVRVSPSAPGGFQGVVRGGGGSGAGLARFGKLSIDGTKVRANASKRKAMSYGARGGAALEGGGVAEHGCGGGRTLWRVVARGRVARRVAPSRGPAGGDCCGEGACGATRGVRGCRPEWERQGGRPYKRAYGEPEDKAQNNFTDPDSAKTGAEGFQQCYNAQVAGRTSVDCCDGRTMQATKGR